MLRLIAFSAYVSGSQASSSARMSPPAAPGYEYNGAALERHYEQGPPFGWAERHVSAYAAAHPWEDWAETFAHYLHIRDALQTAAAFGLLVTGPGLDPDLMAAPTADPQGDFDDIVGDWLPLTYALNAVNRSVGRDDLYPFVLSRPVIDKLAFVHARVEAVATALDYEENESR